MSGSPHINQIPVADLDRVRQRALIIGAVGVIASAAGLFSDSEQFFRSYLVGWTYWTGIALGALGLLMLQHMTGGAWGLMARRVLEAATRTLPLLGLLMVPLLLGLPHVYHWAEPGVVVSDPLLAPKAWYLSVPFFIGRSVFYFALWTILALALSRFSARQDKGGDPHAAALKMRTVAAPGILLFALTMTFAAVDWLMSIDPHWYSSLFGVYFIGGQAIAGMAFVIVVARFLSKREPMQSVLTTKHFHDYGNLLMAFVMLWTYFAVSQFLIIWSGNLPEETTWYLDRGTGGWRTVSLTLVLLHFALPFMFLLSTYIKKNAGLLVRIAGLLLIMRWVDLYWLVAPAFHHGGPYFHWLDLATVLAVGGIWVAFLCGQLTSRPLLPGNDPFLQEVLDVE